jgi:hypothetical protein
MSAPDAASACTFDWRKHTPMHPCSAHTHAHGLNHILTAPCSAEVCQFHLTPHMIIECRECATSDNYEEASSLARKAGAAIVGIVNYDPVSLLVSYTGAVPFAAFDSSVFEPDEVQLACLRSGKRASRFISERTDEVFDKKLVYQGNPDTIGPFELD